LEQLRATEPDAEKDVVAAAGLSLGEYTALVFAGALSFEDGLRVVKARGEAMQAAAEATPSGMVAVIGLEVPEVESLVIEARPAGTLQIANYLCPGNTVVSGSIGAITKLEEVCQQRGGIRATRLAVAGAFHTDLMKPADEKLAAALAGITIRPPRVPVWSNVDARPHTDPDEIRGRLVRQVVSPVRWEDTMRGLLAEGVERFYEVGPGRVLAGLMKRVNRRANRVGRATRHRDRLRAPRREQGDGHPQHQLHRGHRCRLARHRRAGDGAGGGVRHPDSRRPGREDQDGRRGDRLHRERGQEQATTAVVSSMTRRRAVITGLGTVNPLALHVPDYWRALLAGQSGIAPITHFDTSAFKVH